MFQKLIPLLIFPMCACATNAVFMITPSSNSAITLKRSSSTTLSYTVTNNTSAAFSQMSVDPGNGLSSDTAAAISLASNTCSGTLGAGGTCNFTLQIQGNSTLPDSFTLSPKVCARNNSICSQPLASQRVSVTMLSPVYITSRNTGLIYVCNISINDGTINNCSIAASGFNTPLGAALNSAGTIVYVSDVGENGVSICISNNTGILSCGAPNTGFSAPQGVTVQTISDITYVYVANSLNNTISICDTTLSSCATTGSGFSGPTSITFNPNTNVAYITNRTADTVSWCTVNDDGTLSDCATTGSGFSGPQTIILNPAGTYAYVTNNLSTTVGVTLCQVTSSGSLNNCGATGSGFLFPYSMAIDASNTYAYVTVADDNEIFLCNVTGNNGTLNSCATLQSQFFTPSAIILS